MLNSKIRLSCLLLLLTACGYSQNWKADLLAMNKTYLNARTFSMDVLVESYDKISDAKPNLVYKGKVAKNEDSYFSTITGKTTITNKHCTLVIDEGQKLILYKAREKNTSPGFFSMVNLDSALLLMTKENEVSYTTKNSGESSIQLADKNNPGTKMEITINTLNSTLSRIVYYTEHPAGKSKMTSKVLVSYNNSKINERVPDELFSEKKYITKKQGKIIPTQQYNHYQLVNESQSITP